MTCGTYNWSLDRTCTLERGHEGRHEWNDSLVTMSWPNYAEMFARDVDKSQPKS